MRHVLHGACAALLAFLLAAAPVRAAATDPFEGAWVAKLDRNRSNFLTNLLSQLSITSNTEVWLIEGQDIRAFGPNKVFRVQSIDGTTLVASEDWTRDVDLAPATNQRRPDVVSRVTIRLDPAAQTMVITEAKGGETRTLVARAPAGMAAAGGQGPVAAQACADVPAAAEMRLQLVRTQQELAQCRAAQAARPPASPAPAPAPASPPPAPTPAPAPAAAACPPFAGGPTAIRIQGAADGAARPVLAIKSTDRSVTLTGRSGFGGELASVQGGGRRGTVDTCGVFAVTAFIEPGTNSVTVTATARDGRRGEITLDLRRE